MSICRQEKEDRRRGEVSKMAREGRMIAMMPLQAAAAALLLLLLVGSTAAVQVTEYVDEAEVEYLPGFDGELQSRHSAGYVTVDTEHNRKLYYYLVHSERDPSSDPVVLWLNGGPGCSSFDGFIFEHGPFYFRLGANSASAGMTASSRKELLRQQRGNSNMSSLEFPTLSVNPYSWSKVATIIYLDSPAGVGLSYSDYHLDYLTDDHKTAKDSHTFLLRFFEAHPDLLANDFYITGESYAGVYVPMLSREVVRGIEAAEEPKINFKGYAIGNGCTDARYDGNALVPFAAGHGLISFDLKKKLEDECKGEYWNAEGGCMDAMQEMYKVLDGLNIYDILEDCYHKPKKPDAADEGDIALGDVVANLLSSFSEVPLLGPIVRWLTATPSENPAREVIDAGFKETVEKLVSHGAHADLPLDTIVGQAFLELRNSSARRSRVLGRAWPLLMTERHGPAKPWPEIAGYLGDEYIPCTDWAIAGSWLNDPEVRRAIHAAPIEVTGKWILCTQKILYTRNGESMIPIHRELTQKGYRALIYSGDHDMCVPYTGSEAWTHDLGYKVKKDWRPWFVHDHQVAGYVVEYEHGLSFATIKGAGHTVPEYKPAEALHFFKRFLERKSF